MAEAVKEDPSEKVNDLSEEEMEERFEENLSRFKDALNQYASE